VRFDNQSIISLSTGVEINQPQVRTNSEQWEKTSCGEASLSSSPMTQRVLEGIPLVVREQIIYVLVIKLGKRDTRYYCVAMELVMEARSHASNEMRWCVATSRSSLEAFCGVREP
jgi:hypothetical protein